MNSFSRTGFVLFGILLSIFVLVALLDFAGGIVDNPFVPGK